MMYIRTTNVYTQVNLRINVNSRMVLHRYLVCANVYMPNKGANKWTFFAPA